MQTAAFTLALAENQLARYWIVVGTLLGALFLGAFLVKRLGLKDKLTRSARRNFQVLDVLPLSRGQKLCVVRCYDRTFLIGVGDKEIHSLAELDQAVVDHDRAREAAAPTAAGRKFSDWLEPLARRSAGQKQANPAPQPSAATQETSPQDERAVRQRLARDLLQRLDGGLPELQVAVPAGKRAQDAGLGRGGVLG